MRAIAVRGLAMVLLMGLMVSCRDDTAAREAEKAKHEAEEARKRAAAAEDARRIAEERHVEWRRAAEKRYDDLRREKQRSNGVHRLKEKQAKGKISTLTVLSISSILGLTVVILLLARERSLRRIVNAALMWVLGKEGGHDA